MRLLHYFSPFPQEPAKVGFRAVIVSPTRELAQQTYRECVRLCVGSGFKVHVLTKAKATANSFGPSSSQRFGVSRVKLTTLSTVDSVVNLLLHETLNARPCFCITSHSLHYLSIVFADILVTTPNRLVHMLSQEPPTIKLSRSVSGSMVYTCLLASYPGSPLLA